MSNVNESHIHSSLNHSCCRSIANSLFATCAFKFCIFELETVRLSSRGEKRHLLFQIAYYHTLIWVKCSCSRSLDSNSNARSSYDTDPLHGIGVTRGFCILEKRLSSIWRKKKVNKEYTYSVASSSFGLGVTVEDLRDGGRNCRSNVNDMNRRF